MTDRDKDLLAAEYALGSLDAEERAQAEEKAKTDNSFAAGVADWEQRLSPLADAVEPVKAPAGLWRRIEAALGGLAGQIQRQPDDLRSMIEDLQRSLAAWRMAAVSAAAAAAAIALAWFGGVDMPFREAEPPSKYVAMLQSEAGKTGFVVTFDMANKTCAVRTVLPDIPDAKAYELWAVMKGKKAPMSLGLVGTSDYAMVPMPATLNAEMMKDGLQLAISVEPPGGAPAGQPMGPVVFAGNLMKLTP